MAGSNKSDITTPYKLQKNGTPFVRGATNIISYNATTLQLNEFQQTAVKMLKCNRMTQKKEVQDLLKDEYEEDFYCIKCGALLDRSDRKCYRCGAFQD
jgi:hypothetical protein